MRSFEVLALQSCQSAARAVDLQAKRSCMRCGRPGPDAPEDSGPQVAAVGSRHVGTTCGLIRPRRRQGRTRSSRQSLHPARRLPSAVPGPEECHLGLDRHVREVRGIGRVHLVVARFGEVDVDLKPKHRLVDSNLVCADGRPGHGSLRFDLPALCRQWAEETGKRLEHRRLSRPVRDPGRTSGPPTRWWSGAVQTTGKSLSRSWRTLISAACLLPQSSIHRKPALPTECGGVR